MMDMLTYALANPHVLMDYATTVLVGVASLVGAASMAVRGLAALTRITPSQADDEALTRLGRGIAVVQVVLDRIALNLPSNHARKG